MSRSTSRPSDTKRAARAYMAANPGVGYQRALAIVTGKTPDPSAAPAATSTVTLHDEDRSLALWFTPSAIREHFEGDPEYGYVADLPDDTLRDVGEWCIQADSLYREFHRLLVENLDMVLAQKAETGAVTLVSELNGTQARLDWPDAVEWIPTPDPGTFDTASEIVNAVNASPDWQIDGPVKYSIDEDAQSDRATVPVRRRLTPAAASREDAAPDKQRTLTVQCTAQATITEEWTFHVPAGYDVLDEEGAPVWMDDLVSDPDVTFIDVVTVKTDNEEDREVVPVEIDSLPVWPVPASG